MPRIPDASQLGYSVPRSRAQHFQDRSGEIVADAIGRFGQVAGRIANDLQEKEDQFDYARAKTSLAAAESEARRALENDNDWQTYEKRYTESMTKAREKAAGMIRGNRDRALFDMDAKLEVDRGIAQVRSLAKRKEIDWGRGEVANAETVNRELFINAVDDQERQRIGAAMLDLYSGARAKGYVDDEEFAKRSKAWVSDAAEAAISTQSPEMRIESLNNRNSIARYVPGDRRADLLRQAQSELRQEQARAEAEERSRLIEVRQSLTDQLRDITVGAQMGLPVSVPSRGLLRTAFGEREGEQRYQLAVKAAQLSSDVASLQQLPMDKLLERVESYRPTQAEGAADQAQLYGHIANSANAIIKQRAEDPAGYLTQFAPKTQAAWQAFQEDGGETARNAYLSAVEADRERLGLPKGDILPNSYAKALAEEIANPKSAEQLASMMESEAQRWGTRWPDVHAQIAKDIPDMAAVIGSGIDRAAAVTLASTAKLKDNELQAMLPPSVKWGDVQADVADKFADVRRSFPAEGARTWEAIRDSAVRLSVSYMQAGDSKDNAVKRAYKELIDKQYAIGEVKNVSFLVPRQFDAGLVEEGAERFIANFTPTADMIVVPPGEDAARFIPRATEAMRQNAYWVSRGDGLGLRLYLGARPTSVSRSFEELQDAETARRANEQADVVKQREEAMRARGAR